ncbi:MAG: hypothetical protein GX354_06540 [Firmicutes bacterium]|jgi:hypothetical protein|nr:hypothetical protein [Bacillota bacterium]
MNKARQVRIQAGLGRLTHRWWFFLAVLLVQFIPPYTSQRYNPIDTGAVIQLILGQALVYSWESWYPLFKIIPLILIIGIILYGNMSSRIFSLYAGITYLLFAFLQSITLTEEYGWGVIISNLLMFLFVALFWFWEAMAGENDFSRPGERSLGNYWALLPAFLAFWGPINMKTMVPDFNPAYILTSGSGLAFCMMTPVYLAVLLFFYPRVNIALMRVTALVGLIIGIYNALVNFIFVPDVLWWNGIIHLPLLFISLYALVLAYRTHPTAPVG